MSDSSSKSTDSVFRRRSYVNREYVDGSRGALMLTDYRLFLASFDNICTIRKMSFLLLSRRAFSVSFKVMAHWTIALHSRAEHLAIS